MNHYGSRLFWGFVIIASGAAFLMRQSGLIHFDIGELASDFWPVILILIGLSGIVGGASGRGNGSLLWASFMVLLGFVFLGNNLGFITWSVGELMRFAGPVALILIGMALVFKPRRKSSFPPDEDEWKPYPGYSEPVPPAPPLHPDPRLEGMDGKDGKDGKDSSEREAVYRPKEDKGNDVRYDRNASGRDSDTGFGMGGGGSGYPSFATKREWKEYRRAMKDGRKHSCRKARRHAHPHAHREQRIEWWNYDPNVQTRSGFIGDLHLGEDYWELKPMNISHFIGDTVIDLTKAQIPKGETKIFISSFIGDVKVFLPSDYEIGVQVFSSAFMGDARILGRKEGGLFRNMNVESPSYGDTDKKIRIVCSTFIGDVRVTKVG